MKTIVLEKEVQKIAELLLSATKTELNILKSNL